MTIALLDLLDLISFFEIFTHYLTVKLVTLFSKMNHKRKISSTHLVSQEHEFDT